jgi:hypothetical protein
MANPSEAQSDLLRSLGAEGYVISTNGEGFAIGKACGDCLLRCVSWALGNWLDGYSDENPPDSILGNDGHLGVLQRLDYATVWTEIEHRLGANLPPRGTA